MAQSFISFSESLKAEIILGSKGIKNYVTAEFWECDIQAVCLESEKVSAFQAWLQREFQDCIRGGYCISKKKVSKRVEGLLGLEGIWLYCIEPDAAIDDNFIIITQNRKVLGVIANEWDVQRVMSYKF